MLRIIHSAIAILALYAFTLTHANAAGKNAEPLGLELGVVNYSQVERELGSQSALTQTGINKFSNGRMFSAEAESLGIDGLNQVGLIFDQSDILVGVILTMRKDPRGVYKTLSGKYKTVTNRIDNFMNNGYAKLAKGDSIIEVDAPHMSFVMEVRYLTKGFQAAFEKATKAEDAENQKRKANAL